MADNADTADTGPARVTPVGTILSARAAAAVLGVNERTVRRAIGRGELPATKYAGTFRVASADLARYRQQIAGAPPPNGAAPNGQSPVRLVPPSALRCPPLPTPLTPLVGRDAEAATVAAWLRATGVRLVTLTGPGGVGKTRLAIQVAAGFAADPTPGSRQEFDDGVCFVALASLADPKLVAAVIAATLGIREEPGRPLATTLAERLRARRLLLVLDNFEQLTAAAPLVADLLVACPELKVLATSRVTLRLSGERGFPVPPLHHPDPARLPTPEQMERYEAVRLFVERVQDVRPAFRVTAENAAPVAAICARLDGLPLALELAARRTNLFTPQALLERLGRRLPLLTDGACDQPARLRTMRDAIAWSHDLLRPSEQRLLRRLAVFAGGWTLAATEAVAGGEGTDVVADLASLVDHSLVRRLDDDAADPRFGMLETIREFALERLEDSGETEACRRRHAAHLLAFAERAEPEWFGPDQRAWLDRLETELDNFRAVLDWTTEQAATEGETALALASALWGFWQTRRLVEGRDRLERVLAATAGLDGAAAARAKALWAAGLLAFDHGDDEAATARLEGSLALSRAGDDPDGAARVLFYLALIALRQGDVDRGAACAEESLALARRTDTWFWVTAAEFALGIVARTQGDHARAITLLEGCLALGRAKGHHWAVAWVLNHLADATRDAGDVERAIAHRRECLGLFAAHGDPIWSASGLTELATLLVGRIPAERAAWLLGAAEAMRDELCVPVLPPARAAYERAVAEVREVLAADFAAAWAAGRAVPADQAIAEATTAGVPPADAGLPREPEQAAKNLGLTARELDVLRLLGDGGSNREIGAALFVSHRTIQVHVGKILAKLGVETRAAAVAQAHRRGLV